MRKLVAIALCMLLFGHSVSAESKYNSKVYFESGNKRVEQIKVDKNKKFSINVVFQADDFDMYGLLTTIDYDKNKLELIECKELGDFRLFTGENVLANRVVINDEKEVEVMKLTFKAKKDGKITLKDTIAADLKEDVELEDVTLEILINKKMNFVLLIPIGLIIVVGVIMIYRKAKKKVKK